MDGGRESVDGGGGNLWMGGMRESLDMEGRRESVNGISGVS